MKYVFFTHTFCPTSVPSKGATILEKCLGSVVTNTRGADAAFAGADSTHAVSADR